MLGSRGGGRGYVKKDSSLCRGKRPIWKRDAFITERKGLGRINFFVPVKGERKFQKKSHNSLLSVVRGRRIREEVLEKGVPFKKRGKKRISTPLKKVCIPLLPTGRKEMERLL